MDRSSHLRHLAFHGGVFLFWIFSLGTLGFREIGAPWLNHQRVSSVVSPSTMGPEGRESWLGIYADQAKIGYLHQKEGASSEVPGGREEWQEGKIVLSMLGERRDLNMTSEMHTNSQGQIARISAELYSAAGRLTVSGVRVGESLQLTLQQGQARWSSTIPLTRPTILPSQLPQLIASGQLKPGRPVSLTLVDPFSLQPGQAEVQLLDRRPFLLGKERVWAHVVELRYQGLSTKSWFGDDGTLLLEESPWGWTLRQEDPSTASRIDLEQWRHPPDLLSMVAVPGDVWIHQPREVTFLQAVVSRPDRPQPELLTIQPDLPPEAPPARPIRDPAFARDLGATPFIQVDRPEIRRRAASVIGAETNSWEAAKRINEWVYRSVRKIPTMGLPVSTEVLRRLEGDCNEHTCLAVALLRASGVPCRIVMGVVYFEGAFVYHTWPRVYVGRWVDLDPTLGQAPVDATHIPLLEADLEESVRMAPLVGRLKINVESYR